MLSFLNHFNTAVIWIFTLMYSYQMFYAVVALLHRKKENEEPPKKLHKFEASSGRITRRSFWT